MSAKHMKLLLAALALLLALTVTFAYAEEGGEAGEAEEGDESGHSNGGSDHSDSDGELGSDSNSSNDSDSGANGDCKVEHCERCHTNRDDICERCEPPYRVDSNNLQCREGALAPMSTATAALAACVVGVAMLAL